jgi:hypothetical protein
LKLAQINPQAITTEGKTRKKKGNFAGDGFFIKCPIIIPWTIRFADGRADSLPVDLVQVILGVKTTFF